MGLEEKIFCGVLRGNEKGKYTFLIWQLVRHKLVFLSLIGTVAQVFVSQDYVHVFLCDSSLNAKLDYLVIFSHDGHKITFLLVHTLKKGGERKKRRGKRPRKGREGKIFKFTFLTIEKRNKHNLRL
jgi:hypothetical protein